MLKGKIEIHNKVSVENAFDEEKGTLLLHITLTKNFEKIYIATLSIWMKILSQNVQGIIVPNSGHWIAEEQPVFVVKLLNNFFSGNPGETSK